MALIDPKTIKNPSHRKVVEYYGNQRSNTPLKTAFHRKVPRGLEWEDEALKPKYNFSKLILDELVYRYYFDSNLTALIYGARADYKSTSALQIKLLCEKIAGFTKHNFKQIVDSDKDLMKIIPRKGKPKVFTTFIKDEWDTSRSGLGNLTISDTVKNNINRARFDRWNLIICTPVFKPYPVDYFLRVYEYTRYGKRDVCLLLYDERMILRGHIILDMPTNKEIDEYLKRKKVFMKHNRKMSYNVDEELMSIAEECIKDPEVLKLLEDMKDRALVKSTRSVLYGYLFTLYPELQSKSMKEDISNKLFWMYVNKTDKLPRA